MSDKINGDALWELLGRDSAAGKALYNLYNADNLHGRASGLQFSERNRQLIERQLPAKKGGAHKPAAAEATKPKHKPRVSVPHFKRSPTSPIEAGVAKLHQIPRRRAAEDILATMEAEAAQAWGCAPPPTGPLLDEHEKERCALLMQHKGKLPAPCELTAASAGRARARAAEAGDDASSSNSKLARRRLLQERFDELVAEVNEREEFLANMQRLRRLTNETAGIIQGEVAQKVMEMGILDQQIKQLKQDADKR